MPESGTASGHIATGAGHRERHCYAGSGVRDACCGGRPVGKTTCGILGSTATIKTSTGLRGLGKLGGRGIDARRCRLSLGLSRRGLRRRKGQVTLRPARRES
eukprot:2272531-Alexandrium_andersonii.AAC.1